MITSFQTLWDGNDKLEKNTSIEKYDEIKVIFLNIIYLSAVWIWRITCQVLT